jgi:hypothetical protein
MHRKYTKADLERIIMIQLENLNAMHDLLSLMKRQNDLIRSVNKKLSEEISDCKQKLYPRAGRGKGKNRLVEENNL